MNYAAGKRSVTLTNQQGTAVLSWTSSALTLGSFVPAGDAFGIGSAYADRLGAITNDPCSVGFTLGGFSYERYVYLSGSASTHLATKAGQDYTLLTVRLAGAPDLTAPTLTLTWPPPNTIFTNDDSLYLRGTAGDNLSLAEVAFCLSTNPVLAGSEEFTGADWDPSTNAWAGWSTSLNRGTNYIFVRATDASGNTRLLKRGVYCRLKSQVSIAADEGAGTTTGVTNGQWLELGKTYTVTIKPDAGQVLVYWTLGDQSGWTNRLKFTMDNGLGLSLHFRSNSLPALHGTYTGLFYNFEQVNLTNAGSFTMTLTPGGAFSGKLYLISNTVSLSGRLRMDWEDANTACAYFSRGPRQAGLSGRLDFDLAGSGIVGGALTNSSGEEADFDGLICPASKAAAKRYNATFSALSSGANFGDHSFAGVNRAANGGVTLSLNIADKCPVVSAGTAICSDGRFPLFASLYAGRGLILGWMSTNGDGATTLEGNDILLAKLVTESACSCYTNAAAARLHAFGLAYVAPAAGTNILGWTRGWIALTDTSYRGFDTDLTFDPLKNSFSFDSLANTNNLTLTLTKSTGQFSGTFGPRKTPTSFKGILLPERGEGLGFYTTNNGVGWVELLNRGD